MKASTDRPGGMAGSATLGAARLAGRSAAGAVGASAEEGGEVGFAVAQADRARQTARAAEIVFRGIRVRSALLKANGAASRVALVKGGAGGARPLFRGARYRVGRFGLFLLALGLASIGRAHPLETTIFGRAIAVPPAGPRRLDGALQFRPLGLQSPRGPVLPEERPSGAHGDQGNRSGADHRRPKAWGQARQSEQEAAHHFSPPATAFARSAPSPR